MKKLFLFLSILTISSSLMAKTNVLAFAGSARGDSYNKKLILEAKELATQMGADVTVIDLKDYPMPFYDADLESTKGMPEPARNLRKLMVNAEAIIIASPEYNASISGELKNVIDWASRDERGAPSREAFKGKKFAIMSASPSPYGGARGLKHLQAIIEAIGGSVVPSQTTIPEAHFYFSAPQKKENPALKQQLHELLN